MDTAHTTPLLVDAIRIPTLPASVERIRAILAGPDVAIPDLVDAFLRDPPLAAKVLKIANSVHYGLREKTTSVQQAISVLGLRTLSMLVLRAGIVSAYANVQSSEGFCLNEVWKHSILTAQVSEDLARRCRRRGSDMTPQDYYTCGLLHDLGKIVLYDNLGELYVEAIRTADDNGDGLEEAEMNMLGMRHSDAGYMAATLWQLPDPIPGVIRCHHRPNALTGCVEIVKVVSCADEVAIAVANNPLAEPKVLRAKVKTLPGGLSEEDLLRAIANAIENWNDIEV